MRGRFDAVGCAVLALASAAGLAACGKGKLGDGAGGVGMVSGIGGVNGTATGSAFDGGARDATAGLGGAFDGGPAGSGGGGPGGGGGFMGTGGAGMLGRGGFGGAVGSGGTMGRLDCYNPPGPACGTLCGNGVVDTCMRQVALSCPTLTFAEDCDGAAFGLDDCAMRGYASGTLLCSADCRFAGQACSPCVTTDPTISFCGQSPIPTTRVGAFALGATDSEVAVASIEYDGQGASYLYFARLSASLALQTFTSLDGNSGPAYFNSLTGTAVAPLPSGWVVAACDVPEIYVHAVDALGQDSGRVVVSASTDNLDWCVWPAPVLAARPGGGPLMLWLTPNGLKSAVIAADGRAARAPKTLIDGDTVLTWESFSAAWVGDAWYVVAPITQAGPNNALLLRLMRVEIDGSATVVADLPTGDYQDWVLMATGGTDLRLTYVGVPPDAANRYEVASLWRRVGPAGALSSPAVEIGPFPEHYGLAPAVAFGDDTVVLVGGDEGKLGVVRVASDGRIVTPLRDVVTGPFTEVALYDMVRRGPDVVAGWISRYADGPISLVRVTP